MVHQHLRVQRAVDGTKIIPLIKRDDYSDNVLSFIHKAAHNTNSDSIKLNVPGAVAQKADSQSDSNNGVAVEVLYVTASASFSGSTLGFVTDSATSTSTPIANIQSSNVAVNAASVAASSPVTSATAATSANSSPRVGTPLAQSRTTATSSPTADAAASANTDGTTISQQPTSSGMTDGAKAGLAIGIILAIALVAGLFFFCWKRSKKNSSNEEYNEKAGFSEKRSSFFGAGSNGGSKRQSADSDKSFGTVHTPATAPRLSLRPVTQFLPAFSEKRKSSMQPQMSERQPQNNPFRDPAAQAQNPFDEGDGSSQHSKKNSWEGSEPPTPKSAQFGTAAAVPVAAVNAQGPPRTQNNVHRVQLDFKPSMDDELELKSGQLVRLLHEYDDGWALCIRMDRSQQGVAPRTCLSKTPVKPRGPPSAGRVSPQGVRGPPPQSPVARKPVPGQAI